MMIDNILFYKKSWVMKPGASGYPLFNALDKPSAPIILICPKSKGGINYDDLIINWGMSTFPNLGGADDHDQWLNHPFAVERSCNKILMYQGFTACDLPTLPYLHTESTPEEIFNFLTLPGKTVVRHLLNSHSGNGIEIIDEDADLPDARLYTKLLDLSIECRFFIVGNRVIDVAQKKKMGKAKREAKGIDSVNPIIKSYQYGWIFSKNNMVDIPDHLKSLAVNASRAMGLDFCAVDIAWTDPEYPVVIETNTAPGLTSETTITNFANAIEDYINVHFWD